MTEAEVEHYLAFYDEGAGNGFLRGLKLALKTALCSPHFLFLDAPPGPLEAHTLAARLAGFFWSSVPDDELRALADNGRLRQPQVLREQVERMLRDEKAAAFHEGFLGQWLDLRKINATAPDERLYPEWDELLEWAAVKETRIYFAGMLDADLGISHVLRSDFTFLNDRLAQHYGIPGVRGVAMRKVKLPPDSPRGGFLSQAAVLKVTADGTISSPVLRGVWVLNRILGQAVPPPPDGVPAIEPDIRGTTTIRAQLDKHRADASCASCHAKMDPPGFALEIFDPIGGQRDRYRADAAAAAETITVARPLTFDYVALRRNPDRRGPMKVDVGLGPKVDASGALPDGRAFADFREFREIVSQQPETLARAFVGHLVTYEVGGLHASEMSFLTAAPHPGTPGYKNTVSVDQIVAEQVGAATRYASLSLSSSNGSLSWSRNGVRIPSESNPAVLFRRLFVNGNPGEVAAMERRLREGHSVLDSVRGETARLMRDVGAGDRERLDQYLTAVRDVEKRLHIEEAWSKRLKPQVALKPITTPPDPNDIIARADLMLTLCHLAFETDSTRVATLSIDPDSGVPPIEGIKETRHNLSHHGKDPGKLEQLRKVEHAELVSLRGVVDRLAASREAGGSLLDRTMVFVGSNLGNASNHDTRNLPALIFGGGFKHGRHLAFDSKDNVPLSNLYLSMLHRYGIPAKAFGTSTGTLRGLEVA